MKLKQMTFLEALEACGSVAKMIKAFGQLYPGKRDKAISTTLNMPGIGECLDKASKIISIELTEKREGRK